MAKKISFNTENIDTNLVIKGTVIVGGLFLAYKIITTLFKGVGLIQDPAKVQEDIKLNKSIQEVGYIMSSQLIKDLQSKGLRYQDLDQTLAKKLRDNFWNAWSFGILDEKTLISIFSQLKTQTQVSVLSAWVEGYYDETIIDHINKHLSSIFATDADRKAITQIFNQIKSLPLGLIK